MNDLFRLLHRAMISSEPLCRPGNDLLSRVLRRSTIGAGAFHGRVRNGIGCSHPAIITRSAKGLNDFWLAPAQAGVWSFSLAFGDASLTGDDAGQLPPIGRYEIGIA